MLIMKQIKVKKIQIQIEKVVTMDEMGVSLEHVDKEKRDWIEKLKKDDSWDPILVTPIKDSGYYLLADGWHRLQAIKELGKNTIEALELPVNEGLSMGKYFTMNDQMYNKVKADRWVLVANGRWSKALKVKKKGEELELELVDKDSVLLVTDQEPRKIL